ncbi:substrate-binding domain-containing protein [Actinorugispora endophytica]|uniref:von Willebrand factor type A domain-containing protein n=1 Tax=Actinorugispora endophytica TaxID=1605990 RepID=A0A4V3D7U4_9ACTN|nr:substrate-binding domain-containing protein [Actinorugispora endophytica]TDQ49277.1 von Willebrand factor type A domain-containing protein [Actinorugispora endophytica]
MAIGRHRLPSPVRRTPAAPVGLTAVVVGVLLVTALAVPAGLRALGCGEPRYLRVAASLSIAPVLQRAADEFNDAGHRVEGVCVYAQADEAPPHRIMTELSGGPGIPSGTAPDVWVPESSAWTELARVSETGARTIDTEPHSLASSPVVLAAPEGAEGVPEGTEASWELVLPGGRAPDRPLVMVDPNRGVDGMTAMYAVRRALGTGDEADAAMTAFVRDVQTDTAFGEIQLDGVYPAPTGVDPLVVAPEQAVWRYNNDAPETPLRVLYPSEGTVSLDYPFVATTGDPLIRAAADELYQVLQAPAYREQLRDLGFREPDGTASRTVSDTGGIVGPPPRTHDELTGDALLTSVQDWNRLSMPSRALVLADVSAEMSEELSEGGPDKIDVAVDAARLGLSLFPDNTDLGLWLLSDGFGPSGRDEARQLTSLRAPASSSAVTMRQELQRIADGITVRGGGPRLYDNILAAYDEMQDAYEEDKINSVILLTAGVDGGSSTLSHGDLVAELRNRFDPDRPVTMFVIAFGARAEADRLAEIAAATSGTSYVTDDAGEIGDIFLGSVSRRLCVPDCEG